MKSMAANASALSLIAAFAALGTVAASAPVGLQYDEIVRVAVGQATPPPPGAFKADLAAINSPQSDPSAQPAPKKRGFGGMLGAVLKGEDPLSAATDDMMQNAASKAMGGMLGSMSAFTAFMRQGKVAHYTYFNGWERVDDVAAQTATISKLDRNQIIYLDLKKKTYRTTDLTEHKTADAEATAAPSKHASRSQEPPEAPGTAVVDFSREGTALGAQTLDGIPTAGFANKMTMAVKQATGSCRNGSFSVASTQYFSKLQEPQVTLAGRPATAAERPASRVPTDPRSIVSRGGCQPTFTVHNSGPTPPLGRFMMYSNVSLQPDDASKEGASTLAFVTERGNVQSLPATVASLFEIPSDFTPAQ